MNKKIRIIRVRNHRKVEKKGFLEKYKDVLEALVSIVTLLGSVYVMMVAFFQFKYSKQAENFYCIDWSYFSKEDLGVAIRLSLVTMLYILWLLQPLLPFWIERSHNHAVPATEPKWSGKGILEIIGHCLPFFVLDLFFCIYFSSILADTIKWYYINHAEAFRLGLCVLIVLLGDYAIEYIKLCIKENCFINIFDKILIKNLKGIFFNVKIFILCICSLILCFFLPSHIFGDKAIQININIIIIIKILSFILAQLFFFGILSSKPEEYTGGQPEEQKDNNDCKKEQDQSKELKSNWIEIVAVLFLALVYAIIFCSILYVFELNLAVLNPRNKKFYEISDEQKASDSNLQVVILHTGSQVLLMNGTIDDGEVEIKSPKDITSSSNLYLDISSYEIHDADKYIFYRKRFASVKRKYGDYLLDKDDEGKQ